MTDTKATSWLTGRQVGHEEWENIQLLSPDNGTDTFGAIIAGVFLVGAREPDEKGRLWDEVRIVDADGKYTGGHFRRSQQLTLGF